MWLYEKLVEAGKIIQLPTFENAVLHYTKYALGIAAWLCRLHFRAAA